jgi:nucleoside-diphosphate-sugar epimerase
MMTDTDNLIVIGGAGGFIGGHLVAELVRQGHRRIRAVDIKPFDDWYQRFPPVENLRLDLRERDAGQTAASGAAIAYNLAADMGGGGLRREQPRPLHAVSTHQHAFLMAAREFSVQRYIYASPACVSTPQTSSAPKQMCRRKKARRIRHARGRVRLAKFFSERMSRHSREDFGLTTRVGRYHNVYGPHGTWDGGT